MNSKFRQGSRRRTTSLEQEAAQLPVVASGLRAGSAAGRASGVQAGEAQGSANAQEPRFRVEQDWGPAQRDGSGLQAGTRQVRAWASPTPFPQLVRGEPAGGQQMCVLSERGTMTTAVTNACIPFSVP